MLNFKYLYISNNYHLSGLMSTKYLSSLLIIIKFLAKFLHLFLHNVQLFIAIRNTMIFLSYKSGVR